MEFEGVEVFGADVDELIELEAEFDFSLAFVLLEEGYVVKRKDAQYGLKKVEDVSPCGQIVTTQIAHVDDEDKVLSYVGGLLPTDMFAQDWIVLR